MACCWLRTCLMPCLPCAFRCQQAHFRNKLPLSLARFGFIPSVGLLRGRVGAQWSGAPKLDALVSSVTWVDGHVR
eukprot:3201988-Heterocapsa_arctica.AAC.1